MEYLWLKLIHIISATVLFGTGMGIAFFMLRAHLSGDPRLIATTARSVVIADACFTAPAVVVQFLTGLRLVQMMNLPLTHGWVFWALILFVLIGACWLPVVWLQWRAQKLAEFALAHEQALPASYFRVMRWWFWLGWPAFLSVIGIFWLMVMKPS